MEIVNNFEFYNEQRDIQKDIIGEVKGIFDFFVVEVEGINSSVNEERDVVSD